MAWRRRIVSKISLHTSGRLFLTTTSMIMGYVLSGRWMSLLSSFPFMKIARRRHSSQNVPRVKQASQPEAAFPVLSWPMPNLSPSLARVSATPVKCSVGSPGSAQALGTAAWCFGASG
ncbi:hypothetical protein BJY00DRAFT_280771 [Aspergillus carlsbadensis]|nr:hypothetical protein BJY00DRAFT_280771 [Aspergillus carlsbadensis]